MRANLIGQDSKGVTTMNHSTPKVFEFSKIILVLKIAGSTCHSVIAWMFELDLNIWILGFKLILLSCATKFFTWVCSKFYRKVSHVVYLSLKSICLAFQELFKKLLNPLLQKIIIAMGLLGHILIYTMDPNGTHW